MDGITITLWAIASFCVAGAGICCLIGIVWMVKDAQDKVLRNRNIEGRQQSERP